MRRNFTSLTVLCEDLQQRCFIYRYLCRKGISRHAIRFNMSPAGQGAAEQYVREHFPVEVRANRCRLVKSCGLIVIIDADELSCQARHLQLEKSLDDGGQSATSPDEPIAILVPKRNIETWIHFLLGEAVNEDDDYPKFRDSQRHCDPAVKELVERCPSSMKPSSPPSLLAGCNALTQLFT
jgi:hypothetical protein